jgi:hypothetical protein
MGHVLQSMIIKAMMVFAHYFLLGDDVFGENGFIVLSWWCLDRCYKKWNLVAGFFFYVVLISFLAGCNLYLCDINIFPLLEKMFCNLVAISLKFFHLYSM